MRNLMMPGAGALWLAAGAAAAEPVNGGFESGTLAGWYSSGSALVVDASTAYAPLAGGRGRFYATDGVTESWFDHDSGLHSFQFTSSGTWWEYFGLYQTEDPYLWSAMEVDAVTLSAVPEPAPLLLAAAGTWLLLLLHRRRAHAATRR